jgi:hypothetical protein
MKKLAVVLLALGILLTFAAPALASPMSQAMSVDRPHSSAVTYASPRLTSGERPIKPYPSYTYYSELGDILKSIDARSDRVSVKVFGESAGGRPLYLVTIQNKWASPAARQRWLKFIKLQIEDPSAAAAMLAKGGDLRMPVFINASIHGGETTGVDAGLMLIRKLAFSNDAVTKKILKNDVVLINACQNPDGRVLDIRQNDNGFDLNRDWVTQSQPEVEAMVEQIVKWHPAMFLDLHGYYNPMIIDPTTNPHDPNYEWDLSIKWALPAAESIEAAIEDNTIVEVDIPYRDWINPSTGKSEGFEDYSPYYTPQFAMFYGLVGSTMETSYKTEDGVDAHYYGILEGAEYAADNRVGMLTDQLNRFLRAESGASQPVSADVPEPITYPFAYVIPVDPSLQTNDLQARYAVRHLLQNGIRVFKATASFSVPGGRQFPAGSYIVPLRQPLRGIANAMLWYGEDISGQATEMYDACAWQLPESWGFTRYQVDDVFSVSQTPVTSAENPDGTLSGNGPTYMITNSSNNAVAAVNALLSDAVKVDRVVAAPSASVPLGAFLITSSQPRVRTTLLAAAKFFSVDVKTVDAGSVKTQALYFKDRRGAITGLPKVAVYYDGPTWYALQNLFFQAERVDENVDLTQYDVLVCDDTSGLDIPAVKEWVKGGGTYIANGPYGIIDGLLPVTGQGGVSSDFYWANNTLGATHYADDSLNTAGLGDSGYTFAFPVTWFTDLGPGVSTDAAYEDPFMLAGFWVGQPPLLDAVGKPIVVHGFYGDGRVTYFGPVTAFRAGTEGTFRLLANAIYTGSYDDTPQR